MTTTRRSLALAALALWQGGFTFYAAVVVPIGTAHLGTATEQGLITRQVTIWLNLIGATALPVLAWEVWTTPGRVRRWLWLVFAVTLAVLFVLHPQLEAWIDVELGRVTDRPGFRLRHKTYLWVSTAQWLAGLAWLVFSVRDWQRADRVSVT